MERPSNYAYDLHGQLALRFACNNFSDLLFFNLIIFFFVAWIVLSRIVVIIEDLFFLFGISYFKIVSDLF